MLVLCLFGVTPELRVLSSPMLRYRWSPRSLLQEYVLFCSRRQARRRSSCLGFSTVPSRPLCFAWWCSCAITFLQDPCIALRYFCYRSIIAFLFHADNLLLTSCWSSAERGINITGYWSPIRRPIDVTVLLIISSIQFAVNPSALAQQLVVLLYHRVKIYA